MIMDSCFLKGKSIFITGGASGIGLACAKLCLAHGSRVTTLDKEDMMPLDDLHTHLVADVSDERLVRDLLEGDSASTIDGLCCAAGILGPPMEPGRVSTSVFHQVMEVNFYGTLHAIEAAIPGMVRNGGGSVVAIGSVSAYSGSAEHPAYGVSKAALALLARHYAKRLGRHAIRVNTIHPGSVWGTNLWKSDPVKPQPPDKDSYLHLVRQIPTGRPLSPDEVARVAVFLLSDVSSGMTGAQIVVDRGETL